MAQTDMDHVAEPFSRLRAAFVLPPTWRRYAGLLAVAATAYGCAASPATTRPLVPEASTAPSAAVSDEEFAGAMVDLLMTDPESRERSARLVGVTQRQFTRAQRQFKGRSPEQGLRLLSGALYTLRVGEFRDELLGPDGVAAFRSASRELAGRGDEGRARAAYEVLQRAGGAPDKVAAQEHLASLARWNADLAATAGPVGAASRAVTVAVARHLFETSGASLDEAAGAIGAWASRSAELRAEYRRTRVQPAREEGAEAIRAFASGPAILVAIFARSGKVAAARELIDKSGLRPLLRPDLSAALNAVADAPTAANWLALGAAFTPAPAQATAQSEDDAMEDLEVFRVAASACAIEAFRLDATNPQAAARAALALKELGLIEVAPKLFDASLMAARTGGSSASRTNSELQLVRLGIAATREAVHAGLADDDVAVARRSYQAGTRLRAAAAGKRAEFGAALAEMDADLGTAELGEGELVLARGLLGSASELANSPRVLIPLAQLDRHEGQLVRAQARLEKVLAQAPTADRAAELSAAALELANLHAAAGRVSEAERALQVAYTNARFAADQALPAPRVAGFLALAEVYDRVQHASDAQAALDSAFDAARREPQLQEQCVRQLGARAFRRSDLPAARDAFKRAQALELPLPQTSYFAIWLSLLESDAKAAHDPAAARVLAVASEDSRWFGSVARFVAGQNTANGLLTAARSGAERTEAHFYLARMAGGASNVAELRLALSSGGLRLVEYAIARDWLTPPRPLDPAFLRKP